jgi:hypothetical protein
MDGVIELSAIQVGTFFSCSSYVTLRSTKYYYTKVMYFPKIHNHTSLYGPIISGTSVDTTSQVCLSAVVVLSNIGD